MEKILFDIQSDTLAFIVLIGLVVELVLAFVNFFNQEKLSAHSKRIAILPIVFILLGFPVLVDLVRVGGFGTVFSILIMAILLWNLYVIIVQLKKQQFLSYVENGSTLTFPTLIVGGLLTAGYLTYVEVTASKAICGIDFPGCGTVQSSSYAMLLGFMPVALLGLLGYLVIVITWLFNQSKQERIKPFTSYMQWGLCLFGVIFSIYLTCLEVFVLRATCSWCITSAVLMGVLLWLSTPPAAEAWHKRQQELEDAEEDDD